MRLPVIVFAALLATAACAFAQATQAGGATGKAPQGDVTVAPAGANPALDAYLKNWESEMRKITNLSAGVARIDVDKSFKTTTKYTGYALYQRSGTGPTALNMAVLELNPEGKKDIFEKFVCTGTYLYQWAPAQKEIRAYEIPR